MDHDGGATSTDQARIFINLGKRQGFRAGDLARLLQDEAGLEADEVGRIQVRDSFSFASLPDGRADTVIERLSGKEIEERTLRVERAKKT